MQSLIEDYSEGNSGNGDDYYYNPHYYGRQSLSQIMGPRPYSAQLLQHLQRRRRPGLSYADRMLLSGAASAIDMDTSYSGGGGGGYDDCCPLVVDPLTLIALLGMPINFMCQSVFGT